MKNKIITILIVGILATIPFNPALAADGDIINLFPPGNNGSISGTGVIETESSEIFEFQTPRDNNGSILEIGDKVSFDIDESGNILRVQVTEPTVDNSISCEQTGTFLNLKDLSMSLKLLNYTRDASINSLIITKSIDESSPLLEELLDSEKDVSNGTLYSCVSSDIGNLQNYNLANFKGITVDSIKQKVTQTLVIEEISFMVSGIDELFLEKESFVQSSEIVIPDWIKNQGKWWASKSISDDEFINAIEYLINEEIIVAPQEQASEPEDTQKTIPDWIRNTVNWWSEDIISDQEMANALQFLIRTGVIGI